MKSLPALERRQRRLERKISINKRKVNELYSQISLLKGENSILDDDILFITAIKDVQNP